MNCEFSIKGVLEDDDETFVDMKLTVLNNKAMVIGNGTPNFY